jgi:hypothetical protein
LGVGRRWWECGSCGWGSSRDCWLKHAADGKSSVGTACYAEFEERDADGIDSRWEDDANAGWR